MRGAYLLALLISLGGMVVIDARWRLVMWHDARRGAVTLAIGLVAFLVWDAVAIGQGIFLRGDGRWSTGIEIAPHMPIEEPVFLLFLCYLALIAVTGARRLLQARRPAAAEPQAAGERR